MGLFGVGEILYNLEERHGKVHVPAAIANIWPSRKDLKAASPAIGRGSVIGFFLGVLPGGGAVMASLAAYAAEKRVAKDPSRFGRGAIEGVAGPESANNAAATSSFIPLLTIGIPANASMAMLFAALLVVGVSPARSSSRSDPELFWGVINSMYIGNLILLMLSIPLVGVFVKILRVRPAILAPITALITILGVYTINNSVFDIFVMIAFGILGYLMKKTGFEPGPLVLAFVLGSLDGVELPALHADLRRRPDRLRHPADLRAILAFLLLVLLLAGQAAVRRRGHDARPATADPATDPTSAAHPPRTSRDIRRPTPTRKQASDDHPDRLRAHPRRRGGPRGRHWPRPPCTATTW